MTETAPIILKIRGDREALARLVEVSSNSESLRIGGLVPASTVGESPDATLNPRRVTASLAIVTAILVAADKGVVLADHVLDLVQTHSQTVQILDREGSPITAVDPSTSPTEFKRLLDQYLQQQP